MTELPKENVTFICNNCLSIIRSSDEVEKRFSDLSILLEMNYGMILAFAEIVGNRWKFFCGSIEFATPFFKYSNGEYGIMIQDWGIFATEEREIVDIILDNIV